MMMDCIGESHLLACIADDLGDNTPKKNKKLYITKQF